MERKYKISPVCPHCGEEHSIWKITLEESEQKMIDDYWSNNQRKSLLAIMLSPAPLLVTRELRCPVCGKQFKATTAIYPMDEVGFSHTDWIGD